MRAVVILALAIAGCGGSGMSGGPDLAPACPNDLPQACPAPMPTWDGGVNALVASKCAPCHQPGGTAATWPFTSAAQVHALRQAVIDQVYSCVMPPPDAGQLDETQRQALLGWLVCGALNN
jgi:hypothetical protein